MERKLNIGWQPHVRAARMVVLEIIEDCYMQSCCSLHFRHPGESRDPLNSLRVISAAQIALIQWIPAFAGMTDEPVTFCEA